jgi:hypothetical protein
MVREEFCQHGDEILPGGVGGEDQHKLRSHQEQVGQGKLAEIHGGSSIRAVSIKESASSPEMSHRRGGI